MLTARKKDGQPNQWAILYGEAEVVAVHMPATVQDAAGALAKYRAIAHEIPATAAILDGQGRPVVFTEDPATLTKLVRDEEGVVSSVSLLAEGHQLLPMEEVDHAATDKQALEFDGYEVADDRVRRKWRARDKSKKELADDARRQERAAWGRTSPAIRRHHLDLENRMRALEGKDPVTEDELVAGL